jgi:uncharacterized membrane protein
MDKRPKRNKSKGPVKKINPKKPIANPTPARVAHAQLVHHTGPLPHPEILSNYDQILPGAAERILAMAESQSAHRQNLEVKYLAAESRNSLLGIICALFLGLLGLSASGICIYAGHGWPAAALRGATIGSLVGSFIYGTRQRRIEREHKFQLSQSG